MRRLLPLALSVLALLLTPLAPAGAITNGVPDGNNHPYVGEVLFYVPDAADPRFDTPGSWFTCSATLLSPTVVVTAGHCTYGIGKDGASTTTGSGGTDVWVDFNQTPDFSMLEPSSTYAPAGNEQRYSDWSQALNDASGEWHHATSYPHPDFDPNAFFTHDMGVLVLDAPVTGIDEYGQLPSQGLIDQLARDHRATYTAVGYGLEKSTPHAAFGGDTRNQATVTLVNTQGVYGNGKGTAVMFSSNKGKPHTGGTCYGDSGGPTFPNTAGMDHIVLTVTSFGIDPNCASGGGSYRLDQPDDLAFLATFDLTR